MEPVKLKFKDCLTKAIESTSERVPVIGIHAASGTGKTAVIHTLNVQGFENTIFVPVSFSNVTLVNNGLEGVEHALVIRALYRFAIGYQFFFCVNLFSFPSSFFFQCFFSKPIGTGFMML